MEDALLQLLLAKLLALGPVVPLILSALGALVVLGTVYIKLTPKQDDDAWFAKLEAIPVAGLILKMLVSFSPIQRK